jgi:membrane fusion protein (multidrug efflux system)
MNLIAKYLFLLSGSAFLATGCDKAQVAATNSVSAAVPAVSADSTPTTEPTSGPLKPASPTVPGRWVPVERGTVYDLIGAVSTFRARQTTKLGSQVAGRVQEVLVDVGDTVKKGQEMVRLERNFFEIEVDQRKAELEQAKIGLAEVKLKLDRAKELWGTGDAAVISRQQVDDAQSAYNISQARVKKFEQDLRFAQERLKETVIRAPYDAVVSQRLVDPGEPIQAMFVTTLLEVQEISTLELLFAMPQERLREVHTGMLVLFRVQGIEGFTGQGVLETVYPQVDEASRSFRCRVLVKNDDLKLRPGLLGEVGVVRREIKDALVVPRQALTQTSRGYRVQVQQDGVALDRDVEVGVISLLDTAEIKSGLQEGELVLIPERKL